jgi:hypothetical protein
MRKLREKFREIELHPDFVLSNGAFVEVKATRDQSGSNVISEIYIAFPRGKEIPLGGITARVLRELPLDYLRHETGSTQRELELTPEQEERLLMLLKNYPSSPGRVPVLDIYGAATAYFYEKFLNQKPYKPNVALSSVLETPVTTIAKRVATARTNGFLDSGQTPRSGGTARGTITPKAKAEVLKWLRPSDFDYGIGK